VWEETEADIVNNNTREGALKYWTANKFRTDYLPVRAKESISFLRVWQLKSDCRNEQRSTAVFYPATPTMHTTKLQNYISKSQVDKHCETQIIVLLSIVNVEPLVQSSHSLSIHSFIAARRNVLARHLLRRRGCLCVWHVDVLCPSNWVDHHATIIKL